MFHGKKYIKNIFQHVEFILSAARNYQTLLLNL